MRVTGTLDLDGSTIKLDQGGNHTQITSNSPSGDITLTLPDATAGVVGAEHGGDATKVVKFTSDGATTAKALTLDTNHTDDRTLTLPDATDTLVGRATTDTLTNKTLTSPTLTTPTVTVNDDSWSIRDNGDTTKVMQFQVSGVTTGTTRTLTVPDASTTIVGTDATQTLTNKTLTTPTITVNDNAWTMQDNSDTSKKLNLQLSGITTSTTRTLTIPDADTTIVGTDATQTLTNKTLTSPVLTTPTFTAGSNMTLTQQAELRLEDSSGGEYMGLKAPSSITSSYTLSVPSAAPTANSQALCITDYTASPITTQWAAALTSALSDQHMFIGNSSNTSTAVDTQLAGNIEATVLTFEFVDGDVATGTDRITQTAHGLATGDRLFLTTTGTLPTGLSASTEYFAIRVDADTFELATTLANAIAGTQIDITAAAGGGTHTVTASGLETKASSLLATPTITTPVIADSTTLTKDMTFDLSGATAATTTTVAVSQSTDRTLTFPDATDTLVARATTDTLTNKTLGDTNTINAQSDAFTIDDASDATKQIDFALSGATTGAKITLASTATADRTITFPDATGTLAERSAPIEASRVHSVSSANYTVTDTDGYDTILVTTGASDRTITLPTAADNNGREITIQKVDTALGIVIVDGEGAETVAGFSTYKVPLVNDYIKVVCDGSNWYVVGKNDTSVWIDPSTETTFYYSTTAATNVTVDSKYRRVGDSIEWIVHVDFTGAANATGVFSMLPPDGWTINSSNLPDNLSILGISWGYFNSKTYTSMPRRYGTNGGIYFLYGTDTGAASPFHWQGSTTAGSNIPAGVALTSPDQMNCKVLAPVTQWTNS